MKTLEQHNTECMEIAEYYNQYPKSNGIECPECKHELVDIDDMILTSNPPQKNIACPKCKWRGYRIA